MRRARHNLHLFLQTAELSPPKPTSVFRAHLKYRIIQTFSVSLERFSVQTFSNIYYIEVRPAMHEQDALPEQPKSYKSRVGQTVDEGVSSRKPCMKDVTHKKSAKSKVSKLGTN